jgi:hypothetical protein
MATTADQAIIQLLASRADIRDVAGGLLVIVLVALLVEREILRHRISLPAQRRGVTAVAAAVAVAWVTLMTERLAALL